MITPNCPKLDREPVLDIDFRLECINYFSHDWIDPMSWLESTDNSPISITSDVTLDKMELVLRAKASPPTTLDYNRPIKIYFIRHLKFSRK